MNRSPIFIAIIFFAVAASTFATGQRSKDSKPSAEPIVRETYVIGESDLLAISVWHEPDLTRVMPVRSDGKINLPLIGELQASGQTVEQLRTTIATLLKNFLEDPDVTVTVQEPRSQFFTIVGKVVKPGSFPLGQRLTVLDGLAMGGGFPHTLVAKRRTWQSRAIWNQVT